MRKLLILLPLLFAGLPTEQDIKIEEYISPGTPVVCKIESFKEFYTGLAETGFGKLFTDKEIGNFVKSLPLLKKMIDDFNRQVGEFEKEIGLKLDDLLKSISEVWLAGSLHAPWAAVRFKTKDLAKKAEEHLKTKGPRGKYQATGSVLFCTGPSSAMPKKEGQSITTNNAAYTDAIRELKPQKGSLFVFLNLRLLLPRIESLYPLTYTAFVLQPQGKYLDQKFRIGVDPNTKGLIPDWLSAFSGKASQKYAPQCLCLLRKRYRFPEGTQKGGGISKG